MVEQIHKTSGFKFHGQTSMEIPIYERIYEDFGAIPVSDIDIAKARPEAARWRQPSNLSSGCGKEDFQVEEDFAAETLAPDTFLHLSTMTSLDKKPRRSTMCEDDTLRKLFEAELRQARRVDRMEMSDIDFDLTRQRPIGGLMKRNCVKGNVTPTGIEVSDGMLGSMFQHHIRSSYCPRDVYGNENTRCWDPILHDWVELPDCRAALLIPREYYLGRKKLPSASAVSRTLHNRKLIFLISHRPKAGYMWWTFFSSATVASWRLDLCQDAVDRYWPNRGILTADGIFTSFAGSDLAERTSIYDSLAGFSDAELVPNHAALAILAARTISTELEVLWEAVYKISDEG
ncbi:uncharacterized protein CLUP02_16671 [Colletotrichum lupini]|uniref:Uncharacterized protein n=1 Tax=Colletotrichum lupini TaxID=145971 RepID=A0A9Q8T8K0_9PEZI|nr:uncharacterized protein CLUP02_16671 [Colletotrichum lupini]UQC91137.1 hypothetical protein CLUP02_16671 [Colletotrichum lupini]